MTALQIKHGIRFTIFHQMKYEVVCQLRAICNLQASTRQLSICQQWTTRRPHLTVSINKAKLWTWVVAMETAHPGCRAYVHESEEYCYFDTLMWSKVIRLHQITCRPECTIPCQLEYKHKHLHSYSDHYILYLDFVLPGWWRGWRLNLAQRPAGNFACLEHTITRDKSFIRTSKHSNNVLCILFKWFLNNTITFLTLNKIQHCYNVTIINQKNVTIQSTV